MALLESPEFIKLHIHSWKDFKKRERETEPGSYKASLKKRNLFLIFRTKEI